MEIENLVEEDEKVGFFNRIWKRWFGGSSNLIEKVKENEKKCNESRSN